MHPVDAEKLTVYLLLTFEDETDRTICNLIFNELQESKRAASSAPGFAAYQIKKIPRVFRDTFPDANIENDDNSFLLNVSKQIFLIFT